MGYNLTPGMFYFSFISSMNYDSSSVFENFLPQLLHEKTWSNKLFRCKWDLQLKILSELLHWWGSFFLSLSSEKVFLKSSEFFIWSHKLNLFIGFSVLCIFYALIMNTNCVCLNLIWRWFSRQFFCHKYCNYWGTLSIYVWYIFFFF